MCSKSFARVSIPLAATHSCCAEGSDVPTFHGPIFPAPFLSQQSQYWYLCFARISRDRGFIPPSFFMITGCKPIFSVYPSMFTPLSKQKWSIKTRQDSTTAISILASPTLKSIPSLLPTDTPNSPYQHMEVQEPQLKDIVLNIASDFKSRNCAEDSEKFSSEDFCQWPIRCLNQLLANGLMFATVLVYVAASILSEIVFDILYYAMNATFLTPIAHYAHMLYVCSEDDRRAPTPEMPAAPSDVLLQGDHHLEKSCLASENCSTADNTSSDALHDGVVSHCDSAAVSLAGVDACDNEACDSPIDKAQCVSDTESLSEMASPVAPSISPAPTTVEVLQTCISKAGDHSVSPTQPVEDLKVENEDVLPVAPSLPIRVAPLTCAESLCQDFKDILFDPAAGSSYPKRDGTFETDSQLVISAVDFMHEVIVKRQRIIDCLRSKIRKPLSHLEKRRNKCMDAVEPCKELKMLNLLFLQKVRALFSRSGPSESDMHSFRIAIDLDFSLIESYLPELKAAGDADHAKRIRVAIDTIDMTFDHFFKTHIGVSVDNFARHAEELLGVATRTMKRSSFLYFAAHQRIKPVAKSFEQLISSEEVLYSDLLRRLTAIADNYDAQREAVEMYIADSGPLFNCYQNQTLLDVQKDVQIWIKKLRVYEPNYKVPSILIV